MAAETRGDGRFRRLCAPNFSLPRWRYFFEAQRTRPLFARASQLCSRPCFNLRGTPPASLARAVLGVSHVILADSGSADERLLLAIQKPEVTDVGLNSVRVGCHLVGWLRGCSVVADALDIVTFILVSYAVASLPVARLPLPSPQLKVGFRTGPNGFSFDYTVACYAQDTVNCGGVLGGTTAPIDSVSGPLPRDYSRVVADMTVRG